MKQAIKIILLLLAVFPIWLTIVAMGEESRVEAIKAKINAELLRISTERGVARSGMSQKLSEKKFQVLEIQSRAKELQDLDLEGRSEIEISEIVPRGTSKIIFKNLDAEGRLVRMIRIPVRLFIEELAAVATHDISRGEIITTDDFKMEFRDASQFRGDIIHSQDLHQRVARSGIREGEVIYASALEKDSLVVRGDRVKVKVVGTGITLTVVGQALESGDRGQTIKVVNTDSRKEFLGIVIDSKEVEVRL